MGLLQQMIVTLVPTRWAEQMEAESRSWMAQCVRCNREQSIWELGGIRWKASGEPVRWLHCPACGTTRHRIYKRTE